MKVTIQKWKNNISGKEHFRAYILVQDVVVDGVGSTPEEAEEALKMKCGSLLMKTDPEFEKKIKEMMEGLPESKKNEIVKKALQLKIIPPNPPEK